MSQSESIQRVVIDALEEATYRQHIYRDIKNHCLYELLNKDGAEDIFFSNLHSDLGVVLTPRDYEELESSTVAELIESLIPLLERSHSNYLVRAPRSNHENSPILPRHAAQRTMDGRPLHTAYIHTEPVGRSSSLQRVRDSFGYD